VNRTRLPAAFILFLVASLAPLQHASGAEGDTAFLFGLDSSAFPQISAFLSVSNPLGARLANLSAGNLTLAEDGSPARNVVLSEVQTGFRLVVVLDPGLDMTYMLADGEKRIDRLRRTMTDWLGTLPQNGMDDLTLITPEGVAISHTSNAEAFLEGLKAYTPKFPAERPLDTMLVDALGVAADPLPHPGMRALLIVFSASKLSQSENIGKGLCPRALELHATFFGIWAGRAEPSTMPDMEALASLAADCGGYSVTLESSAGTAAVLGMIATQRTQYRVEYRSSIASSGEHALTATVARADFLAETPALRFSVGVQPPDVNWIDFPDRLTRKGGDVSEPMEDYLPLSIDLRAEIAFPDGHPREIAAMQLFADNRLVGECTSACDGIRWDLQEYTESASIELQMVVRDELGLEGKTAQRKFALTVERPSMWEVFREKYLLPVVIILAAVAAGGVFLATMINLQRVRSAQAAEQMLFPGESSLPKPPVEAFKKRVRWMGRKIRPPSDPPAETYAVLETIGAAPRRIEIAAQDVIIGRDPKSAGVVLDDPSVSGRHGRIVRMGDGRPWVFDLGSAAGSWKNFEEIPPEGASLKEGDRLNFGRVAFRVRLKPCPPAKETLDGK
jgi:hypothetical protein